MKDYKYLGSEGEAEVEVRYRLSEEAKEEDFGFLCRMAKVKAL